MQGIHVRSVAAEHSAAGATSTNDVLVAEAHHRIANSLSLIVSVLHMHAATVSKQARDMSSVEVNALLREVAARIVAVAQLHKLLSEQPASGAIDLRGFLRETSRAVVSSVAAAGRVDLSYGSGGPCCVRHDQLVPIALIISELITNAIKHAHPTGVAGRIGVSCSRVGGRVILEVADDGIGLPEGFDPLVDGGLGFRLVRALAHQLRATPVFEQDGIGLVFRLVLPPDES